jgi:predicted subunit of tRNA(5-methylaminomethyl-2-thiouridylate) methyltransferase
MGIVYSKNALNTIGSMYITITFKVVEEKNKTFLSDGNSGFFFNVQKNRKRLLKNAIYNAIKRKFPNRTVTPYDILIIEYHYTYYIDNYQIVEDKKKYYEEFKDLQTNEIKRVEVDKYMLKDNFYLIIPDYNINYHE